jgi:hypothetical protein
VLPGSLIFHAYKKEIQGGASCISTPCTCPRGMYSASLPSHLVLYYLPGCFDILTKFLYLVEMVFVRTGLCTSQAVVNLYLRMRTHIFGFYVELLLQNALLFQETGRNTALCRVTFLLFC